MKKNWIESLLSNPFQYPFFTPEEAAKMIALWRCYGHDDIEERHNGIWINLSSSSKLQVQKNRITFHGDCDDEAIRAGLDHAKREWGGAVKISGSQDFKLRYWAHAQIQGVTVSNYTPPAHLMEEATKLIQEIRTQGFSRRESQRITLQSWRAHHPIIEGAITGFSDVDTSGWSDWHKENLGTVLLPKEVVVSIRNAQGKINSYLLDGKIADNLKVGDSIRANSFDMGSTIYSPINNKINNIVNFGLNPPQDTEHDYKIVSGETLGTSRSEFSGDMFIYWTNIRLQDGRELEVFTGDKTFPAETRFTAILSPEEYNSTRARHLLHVNPVDHSSEIPREYRRAASNFYKYQPA